jgi:hypothetical protein
MSREDVFRNSEGGFVFGFALPPNKGNLRRFKILCLEAERNDDQVKLLTKLIRAFGEQPS